MSLCVMLLRYVAVELLPHVALVARQGKFRSNEVGACLEKSGGEALSGGSACDQGGCGDRSGGAALALPGDPVASLLQRDLEEWRQHEQAGEWERAKKMLARVNGAGAGVHNAKGQALPKYFVPGIFVLLDCSALVRW